MSARRNTLAAGLLAAAMHQAGWAQADAHKALVEQGRYWQAQGNAERASQAWQKLLLLDPAQPEALYGMGVAALKRNDAAGAQGYLSRLRGLAPQGVYTLRLEQDILLAGGPARAELEAARQLAEQASIENDPAKLAQAIRRYDQALGGKPPQGELALEYYRYLGYAENGQPAAVQGLRRLAAQRPDDAGVQLALAQHMVRSEAQRAEGIRLLERLSRRQDVGGAAAEIWRQALTWLGPPRPEEKPLFQAYLQAYPGDTAIREQMQQVRPAGTGGAAAQDPLLARAFKALDAGDLPAAERDFLAKLKQSPEHADALGGLGVVRMQQNDPRQAQALLERAVARAGARGNWRRALDSARYWTQVNGGVAALDAGDPAGARRHLEQALKLDARTPAAHNAMARLRLETGDAAGAEKQYRAVLASHPGDEDALNGLVGVLAQTGRAEQAMQLIGRLTPAQRAKLADPARLRAAVAAGRARTAEQRGDLEGARAALQAALRDDADNPWIRYDLARLYLRAGAPGQARAVVDGLLATHPDMPDALYASALIAAETGDAARAEADLARIPANRRTPGMTAMARQLQLRAQAQHAAQLARGGKPQQARALLAQLEPAAGRDPALVSAVAAAYAEAGDTQRGLAMMRGLVQDPAAPPGPDVLLPYGGLLLRAGEDAQAAEVLRQVQARPLAGEQRRQLDELNKLRTVRQADRLRERGDLVAAYDTLAPVLARQPEDSLALAALARMYADSGDSAKALAYFKQLTEKDPQNAELQMSLAMTANQAGDARSAERAAEQAVALAPHDPQILANAARLYRSRGRLARAETLFAAAVRAQAEREPAVQLAASAPAQASVYDNPFVGLPGQRASATQPAQAVAQAMPVVQPSQPVQAAPAVPASLRPGTALALAPLPLAPQPAPAQPAPGAPPAAPAPSQPAPSQPGQLARLTPYPDSRRTGPGPAAPALPPERADPQRMAAGTPQRTQPDLRAELQQVRAERAPDIRAGAFVRSNNGSAGTSKLTAIEAPVEVRLPLGDGKLVLNATPVRLDAGKLGSDLDSRLLFGGGPLAALGDGPEAADNGRTVGRQRDSGTGFSVAYERRDLKADIGTTPLGLEKSNVVGGVALNSMFPGSRHYWYGVDVSRRAVTDSLLSFGGTRDPRTGQRWGAVTATGAQVQLGADYGTHGVYASGSWHSLKGSQTKSNQRTEVAAGVYRHLVRKDNEMLTAGLHASGTFYDNNQRFYTYGHGGYFSPQSMYYLGVPVTWAKRDERYTYKVQASVGVQHFKEDDADFFPTSSRMQGQAQGRMAAAQAAGLTGNGRARHAGQSQTSVGYSLQAAAEYQVAPKWFVGAGAGLDNAKDYRQWNGGVYLRYSFQPQTDRMALPLTPFRSPYDR
ncbi:cellulose synthase subunit BcsC-related outer membrane protein [Orrella sp. JC864]|uniref:cellulose biosynthesis protein BcsC n=1 Tax=Orrella sp. JC864 TaxID=3120298 RepID=UPI003008FE7B